ncbi:hypothetical protein ACU6QD_10710 [Corynebacterium glucuronolyticum]
MGKKSKKQWYPGKWVPWQSPEGKEWLVDNPKGEGILWGKYYRWVRILGELREGKSQVLATLYIVMGSDHFIPDGVRPEDIDKSWWRPTGAKIQLAKIFKGCPYPNPIDTWEEDEDDPFLFYQEFFPDFAPYQGLTEDDDRLHDMRYSYGEDDKALRQEQKVRFHAKYGARTAHVRILARTDGDHIFNFVDHDESYSVRYSKLEPVLRKLRDAGVQEISLTGLRAAIARQSENGV